MVQPLQGAFLLAASWIECAEPGACVRYMCGSSALGRFLWTSTLQTDIPIALTRTSKYRGRLQRVDDDEKSASFQY